MLIQILIGHACIPLYINALPKYFSQCFYKSALSVLTQILIGHACN